MASRNIKTPTRAITCPKSPARTKTYIVSALTAYSKGERNHPTMGAQAKSFSAQEIADIAAYVSAQKTAK